MIYVGLAGKKGSGKSTFALGMESHRKFASYAFADPLKEGLAKILGCSRAFLEQRHTREVPYKNYGKSPRQMMQTLGTEWARDHVHPDFWILRAKQFVEENQYPSLFGVIFTDVRFPNEADFIRDELSGIIVHIRRKSADAEEDLHPSESCSFLKEEDCVVHNEGNVKDLYEQARNLLDSF